MVGKKKTAVIVLLLFILVGIIYVLSNYDDNTKGQGGKPGEKKLQQKNETGQVSEKNTTEKEGESKRNLEGPLHKKEDVPFEKYKEQYKDSETNLSPQYLINSECEKVALIEFIFLTKKQGKVVPYRFKRGFDADRLSQPCSPDDKNISLPGGPDPEYFRYLIDVGLNCCGLVQPGELLKLNYLGGKTGFNYKFRIPEREELNFFDPSINESDTIENLPVYRWPIFVEDILKTKKTKKQTKPVKRTILVEGVEEVGPQSAVSYIRPMKASDNGHRITGLDPVKQGTWKGELTKEHDEETVLGGSIAVSAGSEEDNEKERWIKLIQYKKNIKKKRVNLSKALDFYYKDQKWIEKQVQLDKYISEIRKNLHKSVRDDVNFEEWFVALEMKNSFGVPVYSTAIKKQGKHYVAKLKAPKGIYQLTTSGERVLEENYTWPPE